MTTEVHESIKTRHKLLRRTQKTNKQGDWNQHSNTKCKTADFIKRSKWSLFCEQIDENKGNPKGIWNALKNPSGLGKQMTKIMELETENETVYDESSIANELNN